VADRGLEAEAQIARDSFWRTATRRVDFTGARRGAVERIPDLALVPPRNAAERTRTSTGVKPTGT